MTPRPDDVTIDKHPAYAQISAGRVSAGGGGPVLYGSDFQHQHFVEITLHHSELRRDLSRDWPHTTERIVTVALSEAQWATFVSSVSVGSGVQCTLVWGDEDGSIPPIDLPTDRRQQFSDEMTDRFDIALDALKKLKADPRSAKWQRDLADTALRNIGPNVDYVADSFDKHMETTVERAKIEANAYLQQILLQLAQPGLTQATQDLLTLPDSDGSNPDR